MFKLRELIGLKANLLLAITGCFFVSCSSQVASVNTSSVLEIESLNGHFNSSNTQAVISANRINYTFSNGMKLRLFTVGEHAFPEGSDVGISRRDQLPEWLESKELEFSNGSLTPQGVGLSPGAKDNRGLSNLWPSAKNLGVMYYEIGGMPTPVLNAINLAITRWNNSRVGVKWRPRISGSPYKYTTFVGGTSGSIAEAFLNNSFAWIGFSAPTCSQNFGFSGSGIGYTDPGAFPVGATLYFNPACFDNYAANLEYFSTLVQHEMGHVVGLWHEQQRSGRSNFVTVAPGGPFDVNYYYNFAEKADLNAQNYGDYDFSSVMHYSYSQNPPLVLSARSGGPAAGTVFCGSPTSPGPTANRTSGGLSNGDINAINTLYSKGTVIPGCLP